MENLTAGEGEAVDERQTIKPVVVVGVSHGEKTRPVPQQSALQPRRDGTWNPNRWDSNHAFHNHKESSKMMSNCKQEVKKD